MNSASERTVRVAIVGRPNVGKSTLFNRLVRKRKAITLDTPGITRDPVRETVTWYGRKLCIIDTGGLGGEAEIELASQVHDHTVAVLDEADVVVVLLDARAGVGALDADTVALAARSGRPVIYVANKAEARTAEDDLVDFCQLGIDLPIPVSAEHGLGFSELKDAIIEAADLVAPLPDEDEESVEDAAFPAEDTEATGAPEADANTDARPIRATRVALVGKPNVGKSSLLNLVAGAELSLVDDRPGTTRDVVDIEIEREGRRYLLLDTAGMRRPSRVEEGVERISVRRSIEAIDRADVVVLLADVREGLADQDVRIARRAWEEGRSLVLILNKVDLVGRGEMRVIGEEVRRRYPTFVNAPLGFLSVASGEGVDECFRLIDMAHAAHNLVIPTTTINRLLAEVAERREPPVLGRGRLKMLYGTQTALRPPTVTIFVNRSGVPDAYRRFLERCFREQLPLEGSPLRLKMVRRDSHGERR